MTVLHRNIIDPDIHEPKGCSSATSNTVYIADGNGTGSWNRISATGELFISEDKTISVPAAVDATLKTNSDYIKLNATDMWSGGIQDGVNFDSTAGDLVITRAGKYELSMWATQYVGGSQTRNVAFKYSINGVLSDRKVATSSYHSGQLNSVSAVGFVELNAGDRVSLYVACSGAVNLTVTDATFVAKGRFS